MYAILGRVHQGIQATPHTQAKAATRGTTRDSHRSALGIVYMLGGLDAIDRAGKDKKCRQELL
jgi:hypothetical protein